MAVLTVATAEAALSSLWPATYRLRSCSPDFWTLDLVPELQVAFAESVVRLMIFSAHLLQENCREQHHELYLAFVDQIKSFDTVNCL